MRHNMKRNKLSRNSAERKALLSNLSKQLIEHERIETSQAKAKAVKPDVEKLITLAKRGDLHAQPVVQQQRAARLLLPLHRRHQHLHGPLRRPGGRL